MFYQDIVIGSTCFLVGYRGQLFDYADVHVKERYREFLDFLNLNIKSYYLNTRDSVS